MRLSKPTSGDVATTVRRSSDIPPSVTSRLPSILREEPVHTPGARLRSDDRVCGMPDDARPHLLSPSQLHAWVESSLRASGLGVLELSTGTSKPYRFAIGGDPVTSPTVIRIYAWNASHGGGPARAADEYRIQLTGEMPHRAPGETLAIIGWSAAHEVFVGWDPHAHDARVSSSPSLQVREEVMQRARRFGIAAALRASGDVVVAFVPQLLAAYCLSLDEVHGGQDLDTVDWLNTIGTLRVPVGQPRPTVSRRLEVAYRAWDFSARIQLAYEHRCAICGLGLGLVEAAHIVPVAWPGSTDETSNGLALCRNHHAAYDRALLSVSPDLTIELSATYTDSMMIAPSAIDTRWLQDFDGMPLSFVPNHPLERPDPQYLTLGREARAWQG